MSDGYEKQVYLAMLAEQCNRFEDMSEFLEEMVKGKKDDLSSDERNLLSIAYKNTISLRRQAIRTLMAYESKEKKKSDSPYLPYIVEYKERVENELETLAKKINANIDSYLLPKANNSESLVFYHKMKADYYRYVAENLSDERKGKYAEDSLQSYNKATEAAKDLEITNAIRLGLALNFSVFYYEVLSNSEKAREIAKEILDESRKSLEGVDEEDENYRDTFSIINLLQENLTMWTNEDDI
jgi:14-3-3 protein epsilon